MIARVEELVEEEDALKMTDGYLMLEWMPGVLVTDDHDENVNADNNNENDDNESNSSQEGSDDNNDDNNEGDNKQNIFANQIEEENNYITEEEETDVSTDNEDQEEEDDDSSSSTSLEEDGNALDTIQKEEEEGAVFDEEMIRSDDKGIGIQEDFGSPYIKPSTRSETSSRPIRENAGKGIDRIEMSFKGKIYNEKKRV